MFQARTAPIVPATVFKPENISDDDWNLCNGMSCDEHKRVQRKMMTYIMAGAAADGIQFDVEVGMYMRVFTN